MKRKLTTIRADADLKIADIKHSADSKLLVACFANLKALTSQAAKPGPNQVHAVQSLITVAVASCEAVADMWENPQQREMVRDIARFFEQLPATFSNSSSLLCAENPPPTRGEKMQSEICGTSSTANRKTLGAPTKMDALGIEICLFRENVLARKFIAGARLRYSHASCRAITTSGKQTERDYFAAEHLILLSGEKARCVTAWTSAFVDYFKRFRRDEIEHLTPDSELDDETLKEVLRIREYLRDTNPDIPLNLRDHFGLNGEEPSRPLHDMAEARRLSRATSKAAKGEPPEKNLVKAIWTGFNQAVRGRFVTLLSEPHNKSSLNK